MQASDWRSILGRMPRHLLSLRDGATVAGLNAVEARLDDLLPDAYREFLRCANGGWIGDVRIYGTVELRALLRPPKVGTRPRAPWAQPRRLLPIHPVDRFGVECLDLERSGQPIVWCRTQEPHAGDALGGVHPLAVQLVRWRGDRRPAIDDTYVDFVDWALDTMLGTTVA